ncbi:aminopeptidase [Candidatus Woesearchaeota archaeon]|nr:aminopeptidase [Candidatus Woesearchaeota archaeon]
MASLKKAAEVVLKKCMKLKENESCLIVTDENKLKIANAFLSEAGKITKKVKLVQIPVGKVSGEEPPAHVAEQMKEHDVVLMPMTKSLSWTKARKDACAAGARIASMPSITEDIMERTLDIAYEDMKKTTVGLARELGMAQEIEITTPAGTELRLSTKNRKWEGLDSGIYDKPGRWGNLPSGEVFIAPVEGTANGTAVIDASMAGVGKLERPITVAIKDGFAVDFKGGKEAKKLKTMLEKIGSRKAFNIAELGIGTNYKAKVTGIVLEDEKVKGTCHIAFGSNALFGGAVDVPIHVDGVMKKPTIRADGKILIKDGELF